MSVDEQFMLYSYIMTFDDFSNKLRDVKIEYLKSRGKELETVKELEKFIIDKRNQKLSIGAKTLKGLNF